MELAIVHILHKTNFITILLSLFLFEQAFSQYNFNSFYCDETVGNYTKNSDFDINIGTVLPQLIHRGSSKRFDNYTVGQGIDQVYGLYMCRGDLKMQQCQECVDNAAISIIDKCPVEKEAIVWYDECLIRYANRSIFGLEDEFLMSYRWSTANVSNPKEFNTIFGKTVNGSIMEAAYNETSKGFATAEGNITLFEPVYVMAQCTPDILGNQCERCLRVALASMAGCCGTARVSLSMYLPSCWLPYDSSPFLMDPNAPPLAPEPPSSSSSSPSATSFQPPPPVPATGKSASTRTTLSSIWICFGLCLVIVVGLRPTQ